MQNSKTKSLIVGTTLLASSLASAAMVPVVNSGFENPQTSTFTGPGDPGAIPGWTGDVAFGVHNYAILSAVLPGGVPEGSQIGYINEGSIYQNLPALVQANTLYTFSAFIGRRTDNPDAAVILSIETTDGDLLASVGPVNALAGTFESKEVSFTATPLSAHLGEQIRIRISSPLPGVQVNFDHASAAATVVPEPTAVATVGMALLCAARRACRDSRLRAQANS